MSSRRNSSCFSLDAVVVTALARDLAVLVEKAESGRDRWALPYVLPAPSENLKAAAGRLTARVIGKAAEYFEQIGAFGDGKRHPSDLPLSIAYVGTVPRQAVSLGARFHLFPVADLPTLPPRQRLIVEAALGALRAGVGSAPIAFGLLPSTFTLGDLQETYELLLGKRLHKASFRRALDAAQLVEATEHWRSEGRGRPAQLYRFEPTKRKRKSRGVRFDLISATRV